MATGNITVSKDTLTGLITEIASIDASLSAQTGTTSKKALREKVALEVEADATKAVEKIVKALDGLDDKVLVGVVTRLDEAIKGLDERIDAVLEAEKANVQTDAGSVAELREQRKEKVESYKALRKLLETFGVDVSDVPEPKRAGGRKPGSGGGRKRSKVPFEFYMDGKKLGDSQQSFSSMAFYATKGVERGDQGQAAWLKDFLKAQGVEWPGEFKDVELPNGRTISAVRVEIEAEAEAEVEAEAS